MYRYSGDLGIEKCRLVFHLPGRASFQARPFITYSYRIGMRWQSGTVLDFAIAGSTPARGCYGPLKLGKGFAYFN